MLTVAQTPKPKFTLEHKAAVMGAVERSLDAILAGKRSVDRDQKLLVGLAANVMIGAHATATITHRRPYDFDDRAGKPIWHFDARDIVSQDINVEEAFSQEHHLVDLLERMRGGELDEEFVLNLITNVGRIAMHKQCYDLSGLLTNGFNYIANSNDTVGETATSTVLSTEIAANGLTRAQGAVVLPTGSGNVTTVDKTFTATGAQAAQKSALFTASSSGTMNHVLAYAAQKSLTTNDTLQVTFSITLA